MNKVIWIINQYASHLESRHLELAKVFAESGYIVAVITSSFHHGRREYMYEEPVVFRKRADNIYYFYLHAKPQYKANTGKRIFNMMDFCRLYIKKEQEIANITGIPDYIIASSAPPFVWEIGYASAKKYNAKFIAEFRDIWPQSLVEVQGVSQKHPIVSFFTVIEKRAYRRADAIVSTMPHAWEHVCHVSKIPRNKIFWMANGINTQEADENLKGDMQLPEDILDYLSSRWCCIYIGSLVKSECIDYLISAFNSIDDPDLAFVIIGNGHEKNRLMAQAESLGANNIQFFPAIMREQIPKALQLAKVAVAAVGDLDLHRYGFSLNKLNDYLYSGIPTIFVCNSENVVGEAGHFVVPPNDPGAFAEAIKTVKSLDEEKLNELGQKAKMLIKSKYDYKYIGANYIKMLQQL